MSWVSDLVENLVAGFGREVKTEFIHNDIPLPRGMSPANAMAGIGNSSVEPLPGRMVPAYRVIS